MFPYSTITALLALTIGQKNERVPSDLEVFQMRKSAVDEAELWKRKQIEKADDRGSGWCGPESDFDEELDDAKVNV
jgi:hypothetical protein